jgi:hypothetical protein
MHGETFSRRRGAVDYRENEAIAEWRRRRRDMERNSAGTRRLPVHYSVISYTKMFTLRTAGLFEFLPSQLTHMFVASPVVLPDSAGAVTTKQGTHVLNEIAHRELPACDSPSDVTRGKRRLCASITGSFPRLSRV